MQERRFRHHGSSCFVVGVICLNVFAGPDDLRGPGLWGLRPEGGGGGKSQRQPCCAAEVEASGGDVGFAKAGLMAGEADLQPAIAGECAGGAEGSLHDGGESAADL